MGSLSRSACYTDSYLRILVCMVLSPFGTRGLAGLGCEQKQETACYVYYYYYKYDL